VCNVQCANCACTSILTNPGSWYLNYGAHLYVMEGAGLLDLLLLEI